jgi:predicted small metal-binding protein
MDAHKDAAKSTLKRWKVACEDGFEVVSSKEHELVKYVQMHVKEHHNKDVSHDDVLKMAKPV